MSRQSAIHDPVAADGRLPDPAAASAGVHIDNVRDSTLTAHDIVGRDKIVVGDDLGSYNAIGAGAQVIVQALSPAEAHAAAERLVADRLGDALRAYLARYTRLATASVAEPSGANPFRPLRPFTLEDAPHFYGRSDSIVDLWTAVQQARLTILYGPTGAGKSSLLQAGLAARLLADGQLPLYVRLHDQSPASAVKRALLPAVDSAPELASLAAGSLRAFLSALRRQLGEPTVYLLLDQVELFLLPAPAAAQMDFAAELAACLDDPLLDVRWVLAVREEHLSALSGLQPAVANPFASLVRLRPLTRPEAGFVFMTALRRRSVSIETAVLDRLLDELGGDAVDPSRLQLIGHSLVEALAPGQQALTQATYDAVGGAAGILREYLDRVLERYLLPADRETAWQLLAALAEQPHRGATAGELAQTSRQYGRTAADARRVLAALENQQLVRWHDQRCYLASPSLRPRIHAWAAARAVHELARAETVRQLERIRASALRGAIGGAVGFGLAFVVLYASQLVNPGLLPYLAVLRAVPGAVAGLLLTLLVDLALASYHGPRRRWRWLAGGLGGATAFGLALLLHALLRSMLAPRSLIAIALAGGGWGAVVGLGAVWLLSSRRPAWQTLPPVALAAGLTLTLLDRFGHAFDRAEPEAVFLAGLLMPLAILTTIAFSRMRQPVAMQLEAMQPGAAQPGAATLLLDPSSPVPAEEGQGEGQPARFDLPGWAWSK